MRTTLTLEPDVAAEIIRRRRARRTGLKEEINELLRAGLAHERHAPPPRKPFHTRPFDMGEPRIPIDDIGAALTQLDEHERE